MKPPRPLVYYCRDFSFIFWLFSGMTLKRFYGVRELEIAISLFYGMFSWLLVHCEWALRFQEIVLELWVYVGPVRIDGWMADGGAAAEMHYNNPPNWMNAISFLAMTVMGVEVNL